MRRFNIPSKTPEEIQKEWEKINSLDIKSRMKATRSIVATIANSMSDLKEESALLYISILKTAALLPDDNNNASRVLSKIIPAYLKLIGSEQVEIIQEIKSRDLGKGLYVIGDPTLAGEATQWWEKDEKQLLTLMNQGKIFIFGAEDSILGKAKFRLINACEPVMTMKECKQLRDSTPTVIIKIESGRIGVLGAWEEFEMKIEPGNYKICSNKLRGDNYLIILCKTDKEAVNELKTRPDLTNR